MMIQRVKKTLVSKQHEYWFFTVPQSTLQTEMRISMAGYRMQKTDQDISKYLVLKSIALTRGCSFSWHNFISFVFFLGEFLCDVAGRNHQITTKCRNLY